MQRLITMIAVSLFGGALMASSALAEMEATAPAEDAEVYFISPQDGDTLSSPVTVRMGLEGMGVAPAGIEVENTGHHHLLIDKPLDEVDLSAPLPATEQTLHFGGGQTQTTLDLPPGEHTLQLLFMDYRHISFDPAVHSDTITITVE
ncbi:DUF4399 domain-containing protein [Halomonas eurihalina]|uniref:DUF4399 domain-containing protein n=1 Tax=Halomonas eurihalina TaxID=42566 RepID=A0A5D9DBG1_HALER|nr:DUF4399 domain-containing protein [Halomonas eurihalina]MDR5860687.1 DUF4399 domain-containing protein [Halomonas eurihalina]TZG40091.1 DUF4399 domain-containing protein [Halomonas eurihalina]